MRLTAAAAVAGLVALLLVLPFSGQTASPIDFDGYYPYPRLPLISITDVTVGEDAGEAALTITLDRRSDFDVTVDFTTKDGTAAASADYVGKDVRVTIPRGSTSAVVKVGIIDDALKEPDEIFAVELSRASNA